MKNLDQVRAAAAAKVLPEGGIHPFNRSDVVGIPALILTSGLLAAGAFCCEDGKEKRVGMKNAFNAIADFLKSRGLTNASTGQSLITDLAGQNSLALQRATTEALAFLAYLKRFAKKPANI
ncbi:MAG: type III-B CRISPR module-associated protein Cmr5 [Prosthecobacter sp.]|uniref:type III-B CRISPR module-associated protein Cmr5 n=1 Tax=Prosthecobacter sp. TaxID=1965333 RepID=UPI0025D2D1D6|nr:type III-B CRISPR module-associated protein Cmr5 [Prosthecobacter sp.]MCF7786759.1 type III-B CRISPR module-associated protein Cmr5 [Prosthecobacter sp.]